MVAADPSPRIGSLCTGYGGLDMAVRSVFGGRLIWCADNDKHVAAVLDARYPNVPNLGDLTRLDWRTVESVDLISAGFPCQDVSYNGRGAGLEKGVRSGIWKNIVEGIRVVRPKLVVVENVPGLRRRGFDRVLGDLAELGYYAVWASVRASDVGAPHRRERVFILGYRPEAKQILAVAHTRSQRRQRWPTSNEAASWRPSGGSLGPRACAVPAAADGRTPRGNRDRLGALPRGDPPMGSSNRQSSATAQRVRGTWADATLATLQRVADGLTRWFRHRLRAALQRTASDLGQRRRAAAGGSRLTAAGRRCRERNIEYRLAWSVAPFSNNT